MCVLSALGEDLKKDPTSVFSELVAWQGSATPMSITKKGTENNKGEVAYILLLVHSASVWGPLLPVEPVPAMAVPS